MSSEFVQAIEALGKEKGINSFCMRLPRPRFVSRNMKNHHISRRMKMVILSLKVVLRAGLEPTTLCLEGRCIYVQKCQKNAVFRGFLGDF